MINTNEIVKSVINTSFTTVKFVHLHSIIHAFERVVRRSYIVAKLALVQEIRLGSPDCFSL